MCQTTRDNATMTTIQTTHQTTHLTTDPTTAALLSPQPLLPATTTSSKNQTCKCGSRVSDTEVRHSSWTPGTGTLVLLCVNCINPK